MRNVVISAGRRPGMNHQWIVGNCYCHAITERNTILGDSWTFAGG
jgi:hypothetical protein